METSYLAQFFMRIPYIKLSFQNSSIWAQKMATSSVGVFVVGQKERNILTVSELGGNLLSCSVFHEDCIYLVIFSKFSHLGTENGNINRWGFCCGSKRMKVFEVSELCGNLLSCSVFHENSIYQVILSKFIHLGTENGNIIRSCFCCG